MRCALLCAHLSLLLLLFLHSRDLAVSESCPNHCGKVSIPYPFGIGKGCYLNEWFEIRCNNSVSGKLVPYLPKISKEVVSIDLPSRYYQNGEDDPRIFSGLLRIKTAITSMGCSNNSNDELLNFTGSPFSISSSNSLLAIGCNNKATLTHLEPKLVGCISSCLQTKKSHEYCLADTPEVIGQVIGVSIEDIPGSNITRGEGGCRVAFLLNLNDSSFRNKLSDPQWFHDMQYAPLVQLLWVIPMMNLSFIESLGCYNYTQTYYSNLMYNHTQTPDNNFMFPSCVCDYSTSRDDGMEGVRCSCGEGYKGNPYRLNGCKDVDECVGDYGRGGICHGDTCVNTPGHYRCVAKKNKTLPITIGFSVGFGVLICIGVSFWLYKFIKRRRKINRRKKFFKRNGGLLLQQQLTSTEGIIEKTIVFSSKELEKATENFSLNRVLGQGGQGTVYKGMLVDGRIVAVKKSKVVDEDKLEEFINEVVILTQINHRNIVKLLGCCLETNVPLLVYEFIPNGNLFEHLHDEFDDYTMATWEVRLRIAIDIAGALSYLHSSASAPIYHRDIKTTNIMLDEKYRAKVSDFGTSRSVTVDHTHLTTVVSGTVGYVDPEYFQSSQFTDKSDVYSFGVVLVELITGEKPVSFLRSQENRTLATYFILTMKENRLVDIIDARIKNDCKLEQVMTTATLARRCLNLNGKKRPSMREVSMELERIRSPNGDPQPHAHIVEDEAEEIAEEISIGVDSCNIVNVTAPSGFQHDVATTSWLDAEPLFPRQTW